MKKNITLHFLFILITSQAYSNITIQNKDSISLVFIEKQLQNNNEDLKTIESNYVIFKDSIENLSRKVLDNEEHLEKLLLDNDSLSNRIEFLKLANKYSDSILRNDLYTATSNNNDKISIQDSRITDLNLVTNNTNSELQKIENKLELTSTSTTKNIDKLSKVNDSLISNKKNGLILAVIIILLILVIYLVQTKQVAKKQKEILENQIADSQKMADWLITQSETNLSADKSVKIDHSFAKRVADQITTMSLNLSRMDDKIRGFRQLLSSVKKLDMSLKSNGYEIVELLKKPYVEGMNIEVNFAITEDQNEHNIITKIIKPQINFKGKLIQLAQVEVSQCE